MKTSKLKMNPLNPRKIQPEKLEKLCASITALPQMMALRPIVYDPITMHVLGGNQRLAAIRKLGMKDIPDEWAIAATDLTPEQQKEFVLRDNVQFGDWDIEMLSAEFAEFDLGELGLEMPDINVTPPDATEDDFDEPDIQTVQTDIKRGDIIEIGRHRLMCGDSTERADIMLLMGTEKEFNVLTDPPYGISVVKNQTIGGDGAFGGKKNLNGDNFIKANKYHPVAGDETTEAAHIFYQLCVENGIKNIIMWGGNYFTDFLPQGRGWICWDKIDGVEGTTKNFSDIELAWTSFDVPARIIRHRWQGLLKASEHKETRCHPTQKPIALFAECINLYKLTGNILDGFLGSGATMVACHQLDRICYGMEISEQYCQVIVDRMRKLDSNIEIKINGEIYA